MWVVQVTARATDCHSLTPIATHCHSLSLIAGRLVPLASLLPDQVVRLIGHLELGAYAPTIQTMGITGAELVDVTDGDLIELGITIRLHRTRLLKSIADLKARGVPSHMLSGDGGATDGAISAAPPPPPPSAELPAAPGLGALGGGLGGLPLPPGSGSADDMCVICLESRRSHVFLPCGHLCCCEGCIPKANGQCPLCRQSISETHRVFVG